MMYVRFLAITTFDRLVKPFSLFSVDEIPESNLPSTTSFPSVVVNSFLTAMRYSSAEARQRFPRLLQIIESYPETLKDFINQVRYFRKITQRCKLNKRKIW